MQYSLRCQYLIVNTTHINEGLLNARGCIAKILSPLSHDIRARLEFLTYQKYENFKLILIIFIDYIDLCVFVARPAAAAPG